MITTYVFSLVNRFYSPQLDPMNSHLIFPMLTKRCSNLPIHAIQPIGNVPSVFSTPLEKRLNQYI